VVLVALGCATAAREWLPGQMLSVAGIEYPITVFVVGACGAALAMTLLVAGTIQAPSARRAALIVGVGVFGGARVIRGAERPAEAWLCDSHRARRRGADLSRTCAWPARAFGSDRTLCCCDLELRIDRNAIGERCVRSQLRLLFPGHQPKCAETPFRPLSPSGAGRVCIHVTAGAVMFATWKIIQSSIKCRRNRRLRLGNNSQ
jgi:hypothetical protein